MPVDSDACAESLALVAVTLLCCAAYLAGIWYGTQGGFRCTTSEPGIVRCGSDAGTPLPVEPVPTPRPAASSA